jgi:DNA polymerase-2
MDKRVAVPNRYFGVFQNGEIKVRGIDARRRDTPKFIAQTQMEALHLLAKATTGDELSIILPAVISFIRRRLRDLREGRVALEQLLVRQKLSHNLEDYRVPSPAALAAMKLESNGKPVRMGQSTRFLFVRGEQKIAAWDASEEITYSILDFQRYAELMVRAMGNILQPFGIEEGALRQRVLCNASYLELPGLRKKWGKSDYANAYSGSHRYSGGIIRFRVSTSGGKSSCTTCQTTSSSTFK